MRQAISIFSVAFKFAAGAIPRARKMPPARLKVLSAGAVKYVVTDFAARLARETGDEVAFYS